VGPAWSWYSSNDLQYFINQTKGFVDILDYHHYGTGTDAPDDAILMAQTPNWENEINQVRGWLNAAGMSQVQIQVGELNLAWRFADGRTDYLGGDGRFYSSFNVAWSASVIGHILTAGGRGIVYAQQNGPLGIMVEPGNKDAGQPDGTPMPIYHGIGAFQGEGLHSGFGNAMMAASSTNPAIEIYAGSSGNIVLVNKTAANATAVVDINGTTDGPKPVWVTQTTNAFANPVLTSTQVSGGQATLVLQPYQVATVITGAVALPTTTTTSPPATTTLASTTTSSPATTTSAPATTTTLAPGSESRRTNRRLLRDALRRALASH